MSNDKTAIIKRLAEHKWLDYLVKAAVMGLAAWVWNTSTNIVEIRTAMKQDRGQWMSIRENKKILWGLSVKVGVLEELQKWESKSRPEDVRDVKIDVEKIFDEIEKENAHRDEKDIDMFIQQQMPRANK